MVMADMPFMSYQADPGDALKNAGRFMTEGLADIVKIEADATLAPLIERMARAGIPVCGHVGSKPQLAALSGGYTSAGRTPKEAEQIVADAVALERAGCVMLLIEAVPEEVTHRVLEATTVPVIGIGAGPACHGQVLVIQDLLGMSETQPRFAQPVADLGNAIAAAAAEWTKRVGDRRVGGAPSGPISGSGKSPGIREAGRDESTSDPAGSPASETGRPTPIRGSKP
jgi:3-methyl-2-oxobutanoate hydroxymethyltransferase